MQTLVVDFETYFDKDYTLKKIPTLEYVRSPKFKVHGAAIKEADKPSYWITETKLQAYFDSVDWANTEAISHNYLFDGLILYERFGKSPVTRIDTLGLARALLPADLDFDLDSLAVFLEIPGKVDGGKALQKIKGVYDLTPEQETELAGYAVGDAEAAYYFYTTLWPHLPDIERRLLDLTLRCGTEGILRFNHVRAQEARTEAADIRNATIQAAGLTEKTLRSAEKFAAELRTRGVEPPTKISPRTGKDAYAFSKQDRNFLDLLDHPDVAHLANARRAVMSDGGIKRINRLIAITSLEPHTIPMPLNYCGAHTHRWSGTGKINVQNLKKGADGKAGKLRESFEAPKGHVICVADSAQIELRMNLWFCGQNNLLDMLRAGEDLYSYMATRVIGRPVDKTMKKERNFGKVVELGCGFQMGAPKFRATCAIGPMGNDPIFINNEEAYRAIAAYRAEHPFVQNMWKWLSNVAIPKMTDPNCHLERGPVVFKHERIDLPNGLSLLYPGLHINDEGNWSYGCNGIYHKIYGGKMLENIIQCLARIVVAVQMDHINREIEHARVASMTHDEVLAVVPEQHAEEVMSKMFTIMSTPPSWALDLPLAAEGGYAKRYSK